MLGLFTYPMRLSFQASLWLVLPLCASVSIVYKTVRTEDLRRLPLEVAGLFAYMMIGLVALGAALWAIHSYW